MSFTPGFLGLIKSPYLQICVVKDGFKMKTQELTRSSTLSAGSPLTATEGIASANRAIFGGTAKDQLP